LTQDGWENVAPLTQSGNLAKANWSARPAYGLAIELEEVSDNDHSGIVIEDIRIYATRKSDPSPLPKLSLSSQQPDNVFNLGDKVLVEYALSGNTPAEADLELSWRWDNFINDPVDVGGKFSVMPGDEGSIGWTPHEQGPYLFKMRLTNKATGSVLAESWLLVGVRDPNFPASVPPRCPEVVQEDFQAKLSPVDSDIFWSTEFYHRLLDAQYNGQGIPYEKIREAGFNTLSLFQNIAWFEPLPGVYNFATLDHMLDKCERAGLMTELGLWRWDFGEENLQYWNDPYRIRTRDGSAFPGWGNCPSLNSLAYCESMMKAIEVFVRRYRPSPSVAIWHPHPYGVVDHDMSSRASDSGEELFDFSTFARNEYLQFLREKYRNIDTLNAAYGTHYTSFSEVEMPVAEAVIETDSQVAVNLLDVRPGWKDYLAFRDKSTVLGFQAQVNELVRSLDDRPLSGASNTMSASAVGQEIDERKRFNSFYGDQGLEIPSLIRRYLGSTAEDIPYRGEAIKPIYPHRYRDDIRAEMGKVFFNAATVGVRQLNYVFPVWENNPTWTMFSYKPLKVALARNVSAMPWPSEAGLLHSFNTSALEGFTTRSNIEYHRWAELLAWGQTLVTPGLWMEPIRLDGQAGFAQSVSEKRLLIDDNTRIMSAANIETLRQFVAAGGCLLLQCNSGQYLLGEVTPTWPLVTALGYPDSSLLATVIEKEGKATGTGALEGLTLPMRDLVQLNKPNATVVATFEGKPVAQEWAYGKGKVLYLGGTIGDNTGARIRELIKANQKQEIKELLDLMEDRLIETFCALTKQAERWAGIPPQGSLSQAPVEISLRKGTDEIFIAVRNRSSTDLTDIKLEVPLSQTEPLYAEAIFVDRTRKLQVVQKSKHVEVTVPHMLPGEFCLIELKHCAASIDDGSSG
jgi:hypothetical protein